MSVFTDLLNRVYHMLPKPVRPDAARINQQVSALNGLFDPPENPQFGVPQRINSQFTGMAMPSNLDKDSWLGAQVADYESGGKGINAIGYDANGGTSYGIYQHASRVGGMDAFLNQLVKSGAEGASAAAAIRAAGPLNTGSRHGPAVDAYLEQAAKYPELFERVQHDTIYNTQYTPMMNKIPAEARALIDANPALQEMAWSTAVQHGGGGGASVLRKAYRNGMTPADYVQAVYNERGRHFGSSTPQVRASVQNRFRNESARILGLLSTGFTRRAKEINESWGYK